MALLLYGTRGCHLCEQAVGVLHAAGIGVRELDILAHDTLLERYGTRIPVLRRSDSGAELDWPFDAAAVQRFLNDTPA